MPTRIALVLIFTLSAAAAAPESRLPSPVVAGVKEQAQALLDKHTPGATKRAGRAGRG